ncbi:ZIP family metal transporter [Ornithinibacillus sp. L9]|uniref:ZIP family metal transporter n=1 Tax=Ornithinibacillus caprae TaxID=2678566 RepID=A0A6N8FFP7_9BACI|nr:ZIP family metal transporter [Ornithinibacillus caprae]MUK88031.1 ZIP family metal transporter [Ornithinibacillus caprae]
MWYAIMWGTIAASATLLGALLVLKFSIPKRLIAYIMALGTGALIGATTFELLEDAVKWSGFKETAIGFLGGALLFTFFNILVSRRGGHKRKKYDRQEQSEDDAKPESGLAIFIGTVMDTLPESAMIGMSLIGGGSVSLALVISIFISNLPEGISSTVGMQKSGYSKKKIVVLWVLVVFFSALSSWGGALLESASDSIKAIMSAFAGGAIISMIASTMMPEAFKQGGPTVGFVTAIGLFISLWLHHL